MEASARVRSRRTIDPIPSHHDRLGLATGWALVTTVVHAGTLQATQARGKRLEVHGLPVEDRAGDDRYSTGEKQIRPERLVSRSRSLAGTGVDPY